MVLALGMLLLISGLYAALFFRAQLSISTAFWQSASSQALAYQVSAERSAARLLDADDKNSGIDHWGEAWAMPLPAMTLQYGQLQASIHDASAFFNINNLVTDNGLRNDDWTLVFDQLLSYLKLDAGLTDLIVDWLDADEVPTSSDGAEDDLYLLQNTPHRTPNRRIADVGELRQLLNIKEKDFKTLLPFIIALPNASKINLNTASETVLMAVTQQNKSLVQAIMRAQKNSDHDGKTYGGLFANFGATFSQNLLDVKSQYFLLHTYLHGTKYPQRWSALLERGGKTVKVKHRTRIFTP